MNINRLDEWLTLLANVGVLIGLIVVILELRESNRQTTAASNIARYSEIDTSLRDYALSEHLPSIYVLVEKEGVAALDQEQLSRLESWERARMIRMEGQFVQYQDGYLPEAGFQQMKARARQSIALWKELDMEPANPAFRAAIAEEGDT